MRTSTLAILAGIVLLLGGGLLLADALREDERTVQSAQPPEPAPRVVPNRPCAGPMVDSPGDASSAAPGAADEGDVVRPTTRLAATALAVAATAGGLSAPAEADAARARSADSFVESVGVNVHLGYTRTPYARYDKIQDKLVRLGVRYVRDGLNPGQTQVYRAWKSLAKCGIRVNLIVGDPLQRWGIGTLDEQIRIIKRENITEAVASFEGPNEFDNQGESNWKSILRSYQTRLYRKVNSDPELRRFPVLGPSFVKRESRARLGNLSGALDYGNMHPYPGGQAPDRDSHMRDELRLASEVSGRKPVQATETGYHNSVRTPASHKPATERAAGIYMPRLFLDYFRRGIRRTYSYELLDQRPDPDRTNLESRFGLLRNDFSEKPAYTALRRTIDLLSDKGPRFKPGRLAYTVQGDSPGLRRLLLQKRDGTFYLALWKDASVWNADARRTVRASSNEVKLNFARKIRKIEVYRPSDSAKATDARSNTRSLSVAAGASVAIIKINPAGSTKGASHRRKAKDRRLAAQARRKAMRAVVRRA